MRNIDAYTHLRGESVYLDDIPVQQGTLYAAVYDSPVAHGHIESLSLEEASAMPGVIRIFTAADIPGENQIGGILPDEPLLADGKVHFCGMPVALVIATSAEAARAAASKVRAVISPLPVITDPREAQAKNLLIMPPRKFVLGNVDEVWKDCKHIFEGQADVNGQEHLYIETQGAYVYPSENNTLRIFSSTQGPTAVQRIAARVLGCSMHQLEVDVTRLGGGFGGKEDQATTWAVLCALAAWHLKRPVRYSLHRMEDMRMTGKRHPYSADFKIGLSEDLKILAYEVSFFQNAGAAADLSPAVLERTLFHCTNSYFIPNVKATAWSCKTNLPPNTAFRGFGGPQGMFVMESAIAHAAEQLGIPASTIQYKNLIQTGNEFPYGQLAESEAGACWDFANEQFNLKTLQEEAAAFNGKHAFFKKGISVMPICFGISFTKTLMNQGRALVHVYTDGSVGISTGAVEMGQGVNTKMLQVAAAIFAISPDRIRVLTTNTARIANTSPSAASATADLNGRATEMACLAIRKRILEVASAKLGRPAEELSLDNGQLQVAGQPAGLSWQQLVSDTYLQRVSLSEHAHYTPPGIHFDTSREKGHPFTYHVYGVAITGATVDCRRGIYDIDFVKVVHDGGQSMNIAVDKGQCEGGIVQGIGWMTLEELVYDKDGKLRSNALSTYKVPDIYSVPAQIDLVFLPTDRQNLAVRGSKAVGEPPLMYGIGAYFALRNAIKAFNPEAVVAFDAPMTPEKTLMALYKGK